MNARPVAVLLAAGRGSRFDASGRSLKQLATLAAGAQAGTPLAAAAARPLVAALGRVIAVVRPAADENQRRLHAVLAAEGCELVVSTAAELGMGHSIAAGVAASRDAAGWLVALADMPAVQPDSIARVAAAIEAGAVTTAPVFAGARGHPVGFAATLRDELLALTGDSGARAVLARHPPRLIEVDDPGVLRDVDTPAAL